MTSRKPRKSAKHAPESEARKPEEPDTVFEATERDMELFTLVAGRLLMEKGITDEQDISRFMKELHGGRGVCETLESMELNAAEQSFQMMTRAFEAEMFEEAQEFARQALKLDPQNIEAQMIALKVETDAEARDALRGLVRDAEARLGAEFMEEFKGQFGALTPTHPYLRVRLALISTLGMCGDYEDAIAEAEGMLELCPDEEMGVTDYLVAFYLATDNAAEARRLMDVRYKNDNDNPVFDWARVFAYRMIGDEKLARKALKAAHRKNRFMLPMLAGDEEPVQDIQDIEPGSPEEATIVIQALIPAFDKNEEVFEWIFDQLDAGRL